MMRLAVLLYLTGCGRLGFGPVAGSADAASDVDTARTHCGDTGVAPDRITVAGHTFRYTSVADTVADVPGIDVSAIASGTTLAQMTSDAQAAYTLTLPTGGHAVAVQLRYASALYLATTIWLDGAVEHDLLGATSAYAWPGDAPVWNDGAIDSVYSYPGITRDHAAGTAQLNVRQCDGTPVGGVIVSSSRAGVLTYIDSDGIAKTSLTATDGTYGAALFFNADPGPTTFTLSGGGLTWAPLTIDVLAGEEITLAVVRGDP
jgi:hypothetical protein